MIAVLIPVYNEGESLAELLANLDIQLKNKSYSLDVFIINDGGGDCDVYMHPPKYIRCVREIKLAVNIGHQRAIAVGLTELAKINQYSAVVIMDGDGEDKPVDVYNLIDYHFRHFGPVIVASRTARSENIYFRLFYRLYKIIFLLLTWKVINFGNFMLLPSQVVSSIVYDSNIWNHLAATILNSNFVIHRLPTSRGKRYKGKSQMNFGRLVEHGLSAISVFLIPIFTRILILFTVLLIIAVGSIGVVVGIRYFTSFAIPGWATNLTGILLIIIIQLILILLVSTFATLNQRAIFPGIPLLHIRAYIIEIKTIYQRISNERFK